MTSSRTELSHYLSNWQDPLSTSDLAELLGITVATIHVYRSRMESNPFSYRHLLPKHLPKRGKRVLYTKADVIDWWVKFSEPINVKGRGRPTKEAQVKKIHLAKAEL